MFSAITLGVIGTTVSIFMFIAASYMMLASIKNERKLMQEGKPPDLKSVKLFKQAIRMYLVSWLIIFLTFLVL
jgi:hypothetical protein